jgi:transposase
MVREAREQEQGLSVNQAVLRIGSWVGVNPDTLRGWRKQAGIDSGRRAGATTQVAAGLKELEREVRELRRANEMVRFLATACLRGVLFSHISTTGERRGAESAGDRRPSNLIWVMPAQGVGRTGCARASGPSKQAVPVRRMRSRT